MHSKNENCSSSSSSINIFTKLKLASDPHAALKHIVQSGAEMTELSTASARFLVVRLHSANVKRLIRSYNLIKTVDRAGMGAQTVVYYTLIGRYVM